MKPWRVTAERMAVELQHKDGVQEKRGGRGARQAIGEEARPRIHGGDAAQGRSGRWARALRCNVCYAAFRVCQQRSQGPVGEEEVTS